MDVAYDLTPLVATKLVVYTFGALIHLFLMVLIVGNRRLRRFEWLLFALMSALFMWYSGNLLALNVGLFYDASPAFLSGFSRLVSFAGFMLAVPLLVNVQTEYCGNFFPLRAWQRSLIAGFYLPVIAAPWMAGALLRRTGVEPMVALGRPVRFLVLWAALALLVAAGMNLYLYRHRGFANLALGRFHAYLAGLQGILAVGWAAAYLPHALPSVGGLGGYFPTALLAVGILPSGLMAYFILRHNFLDLRVPRNVLYSVVAGFGFLIYLDFMRHLSFWLEAHRVVPAAVTEAVMIFILVVLYEPAKRLMSRVLHRQFVSEFETVQKLALEIEEHAKQTGDVDSLQTLVEARLPKTLGLDGVKLWVGNARQEQRGKSSAVSPHTVPIRRAGNTIARLEVVSDTGELSGEQQAALEILADRLAAALELCQLIADKIKLERELAERARMAFLGEMAARIAHNVKNPLSGMKTIVQLMEEDQTLPEHVRRDSRMLIDEIDRLNRNISQVLRYAKPARDSDRPADLVLVLERVVAISRMEAGRRHVAIVVADHGSCPVQGGEEAVSDIISNLVVNAVEASAEGSVVRIGLAPVPANPDQVELYVEDQGLGIPRDKLETIFQPFFTTRPGGTGLGLAIVKRRLDEIGGSIKCVSPAQEGSASLPPSGSRFTARLRAAKSSLAD